ncbi:NAD-dependent epimerase/dehydratase family protein [Vibrio ostreae]|uniref:NAD(P)-dependent oxidoreductase n=1 Tax=Vibrio ostreae TaxID=2841925 RepID=A0A975U8M8_9VIBR|nr:NAD(P)-dependent oxidoreductase [Vibrio ostreae]QXO17244.1 NAD(P)-dependent oxidoreductase [Vibrio ostreae]
MNKIVITGANGLLARNLIENLRHEFMITAVSRSEIDCRYPDVKYVCSDYEDLVAIFEGHDAVIHLAATRPYRTMDSIYQSNITLDKNVFDSAYLSGVNNIIYTSTRSVYGSSPVPWSERQPVCPENDYARAKISSEELAERYVKNKAMCITSLRLAQIYSDEEYTGSMLNRFFEQARCGKDLYVSVVGGITRVYLYQRCSECHSTGFVRANCSWYL